MTNESTVQANIRLEATALGMRLWRNNVGACTTSSGSFVRYGLANESSLINAVFKSSDLIGIRPVIITQDMVGKTIGQFVAREVKAHGWKYRGTDRERAQRAFIDLILHMGGDAAFATGEGSFSTTGAQSGILGTSSQGVPKHEPK